MLHKGKQSQRRLQQCGLTHSLPYTYSALSKSVVTSCPQARVSVAVGLPQAPLCEKRWAVGHSYGLQGIYLFLGKTDAHTAVILWKEVQNVVGALKAELPFWTGEGSVPGET